MINEKQKSIGFWGMFIIFFIFVIVIALLTSGGKSNTNQPKKLQPDDAQVQWEKEQNDIANEKLKRIYEGIDNGTITCKNGVCYEVQ